MKSYFTAKSLAKYSQHISGLEKKLRELQAQVQYSCEIGGDVWHDNASYEHLVEDIRVADRRLNEAHLLLRNIKLISYPASVDKVVIGCEVKFSVDGEKKSFEIVAHGDEDFTLNRILYEAPIALALMGHSIRENYEVNLVGKTKRIEIEEVKTLSWTNSK